MAHKKPSPLIPRQARSPCPVCGEISYSLAGIHPQCAVRQADARRMEEIRSVRLADDAKPAATTRTWQKVCPQCGLALHVRKKFCDCGHSFALPAGTSRCAGKPK